MDNILRVSTAIDLTGLQSRMPAAAALVQQSTSRIVDQFGRAASARKANWMLCAPTQVGSLTNRGARRWIRRHRGVNRDVSGPQVVRDMTGSMDAPAGRCHPIALDARFRLDQLMPLQRRRLARGKSKPHIVRDPSSSPFTQLRFQHGADLL